MVTSTKCSHRFLESERESGRRPLTYIAERNYFKVPGWSYRPLGLKELSHNASRLNFWVKQAPRRIAKLYPDFLDTLVKKISKNFISKLPST